MIVRGIVGAGAADAPWAAMDYGPYLTASIQMPAPRTNVAFKGIALNLGKRAGSRHWIRYPVRLGKRAGSRHWIRYPVM